MRPTGLRLSSNTAGQVALVSGQPGTGKSRLLAEFAASAGGTVISARAVLPELADETTETAVDPGTSRALILEGSVRLLRASGRVLLLVDDLQWADASSLDQLALLAARADNVSMVLAFRAGEMSGRFLSEFLAEACGVSLDAVAEHLSRLAAAELVPV